MSSERYKKVMGVMDGMNVQLWKTSIGEMMGAGVLSMPGSPGSAPTQTQSQNQ